MKYIFSFLFLSSVYSAEVIQVHNQKNQSHAEIFVKELSKITRIPLSLIQLERSPLDCERPSTTILKVCLTESNDIKIINFDRERYKRMFSVFKRWN